jgi:hypothetical protein
MNQKKTLPDKNGQLLRKGSIVKTQNGHARITAVFPGKQTVNLGSIFGKRILARSVPVGQVYEDEDAWYNAWSQSETYMSM